jgi:hypothetical protein
MDRILVRKPIEISNIEDHKVDEGIILSRVG